MRESLVADLLDVAGLPFKRIAQVASAVLVVVALWLPPLYVRGVQVWIAPQVGRIATIMTDAFPHATPSAKPNPPVPRHRRSRSPR